MGFLQATLKIVPFVVEAVQWVERFVRRKGPEKQDAALQMILSMLSVAEHAKEVDLLDDEEVEAATRKVIDAIVALENLLKKKKS
jgi:hypothetical protein